MNNTKEGVNVIPAIVIVMVVVFINNSAHALESIGDPYLRAYGEVLPGDFMTDVSLFPPVPLSAGDVTITNDSVYVFNKFTTPDPFEGVKYGSASSLSDGVFWAAAQFGTTRWPEYGIGMFGIAGWSQSFTKDTADASFQFTISQALIDANANTGAIRGELYASFTASRFDEQDPFWSMSEHAWLTGRDTGVGINWNIGADGPMTSSIIDTDFRGLEVTGKLLQFDSYTGTVDLSDIFDNEEFYVNFNLYALATVEPGDGGKVSAWIRDPLDPGPSNTNGVSLEINGLTPTNNYISAVPVPAAIWLFGLGLLSLASIAQRKQLNHALPDLSAQTA